MGPIPLAITALLDNLSFGNDLYDPDEDEIAEMVQTIKQLIADAKATADGDRTAYLNCVVYAPLVRCFAFVFFPCALNRHAPIVSPTISETVLSPLLSPLRLCDSHGSAGRGTEGAIKRTR